MAQRAPADWNSLLSPETYLGYGRTMDFASPGGLTPDEPRVYDAPRKLRRNHWSLSGDWTAGAEAVALNEAGGRIASDVHARDVHLVMGPRTREAPVPFRVTLDGEPPGTAHGSDVDADGSGVLTYLRMYQVIRQEGRSATVVSRSSSSSAARRRSPSRSADPKRREVRSTPP